MSRNWTHFLEALMRDFSRFFISGVGTKGSIMRELGNFTCLSVQIMDLFTLSIFIHSQCIVCTKQCVCWKREGYKLTCED